MTKTWDKQQGGAKKFIDYVKETNPDLKLPSMENYIKKNPVPKASFKFKNAK